MGFRRRYVGLFYDVIGNEIGVEMALAEANRLNVAAAVAMAKAVKDAEEEARLRAEQEEQERVQQQQQQQDEQTAGAGATSTADIADTARQETALSPDQAKSTHTTTVDHLSSALDRAASW